MEQNTIDVQINVDCTPEELQAIEWIEKALVRAIHAEEMPLVEVSVIVVDNDKIHEMNKQYREMDRHTDVLSFPLWENASEWEESVMDVIPLGDIVISLPKAKEQAAEYGHSLERELAFLATHGFLHLIGYLHDCEEEEQRMFQRQEQILSEIGLKR